MIDFLCVTTEGLARRTRGAAAAPYAGAAASRARPRPEAPQSGRARGRRTGKTGASRGRRCHKTRAVGCLTLPALGARPFSPETPCDWVARLMWGAARGRYSRQIAALLLVLGGILDGLRARISNMPPNRRPFWQQRAEAGAERARGGREGRAGPRVGWTASSGKQSPPPSARPDDGPGEMPPRGMAARGRFYASSSAARERLYIIFMERMKITRPPRMTRPPMKKTLA